jgi:hypothetical protein
MAEMGHERSCQGKLLDGYLTLLANKRGVAFDGRSASDSFRAGELPSR